MLEPSLIKELKNIVGARHLYTVAEELVAYSYDATRK